MLVIIFALTFATIYALTIGVMIRGESALVRSRMESMRVSGEREARTIMPELSDSFIERVLRPYIGGAGNVFARLAPANAVAATAVRLERAGSPHGMKAVEFVGLKIICRVVFLAGAAACVAFVDIKPLYSAPAGAMVALIGLALPDALLDGAIRARQRLIRKSLADCLDLLVVCAEAGLGFDGAVAKVVERSRGPLADEFKRALQDMSVGRNRMDSLKAMAERIGLPEITTFVAAIHQSDVLGVSAAHVLRVQADSLRMSRNTRARETAAKLPVKMLFPLVLFVFPAIFVILLGPAAIQIYRALSNG